MSCQPFGSSSTNSVYWPGGTARPPRLRAALVYSVVGLPTPARQTVFGCNSAAEPSKISRPLVEAAWYFTAMVLPPMVASASAGVLEMGCASAMELAAMATKMEMMARIDMKLLFLLYDFGRGLVAGVAPDWDCRQKKTRRKRFCRRATSLLFDPVLIASWSPSHRGSRTYTAVPTISLNGGFLDVIQVREFGGEVSIPFD